MLRSVSQQCATCPWRRQGVITGSEQESFTLCLWENIFGKATHNSHISAEFTDQKGQEADGNQMQQLSPPLRDIDDPDFVVLLPQREQSCLGCCRWWPWESSAWCVSSKSLIQKQPCGPVSSWLLCAVRQSPGTGLRQLQRTKPGHSRVRSKWAGSPEINVLLSTGCKVSFFSPKVCCSNSGYLIRGDSLVNPVITDDGHPEGSALSSLAAMWSHWIWHCPEQQTLFTSQKKKRIQIPRLVK